MEGAGSSDARPIRTNKERPHAAEARPAASRSMWRHAESLDCPYSVAKPSASTLRRTGHPIDQSAQRTCLADETLSARLRKRREERDGGAFPVGVVGSGPINAGRGVPRKMQNSVGTSGLDQPLRRAFRQEIGLVPGDCRIRRRRRVRSSSRGCVNAVARANQQRNRVTPDVARCAGHEHAHAALPT